MLRPLLQPATQRLKTAKWQLAAALVASTIPTFAQAQTKLDVLVNHDAFLAQLGDGVVAGSVDGPAGGEFVYRAKVKVNNKEGTVENVLLTQKLPVGAIYQDINHPEDVVCKGMPDKGVAIAEDQVIECTIPKVSTSFVNVDFQVLLPKASTKWPAYASAIAPDNIDPDAGDLEPNHSNISRNITTYERADLAIDITALNQTDAPVTGVTQGDTVKYLVEVSNTDSPYAFALKEGEQARVRFPQPEGVTFASHFIGDGPWTCEKGSDTTSGRPVPVWDCVYTAKVDLEKGKPLSSLIFPAVVNVADGNIAATATVNGYPKDSEQKFLDAYPDNNTDDVTIKVSPNMSLDVKLEKSVTPNVLDKLAAVDSEGYAEVTYKLTASYVSVSSEIKPENLTITDTLPSHVVLVSAEGEGWDCKLSAHPTVYCEIAGSLPGTEAKPVYVKAKVKVADVFALPKDEVEQVPASTVRNSAIVGATNESEKNTDNNNKASADVTVKNTVNLGLTKGTKATVVSSGASYEYTISVTNKDSTLSVLPNQVVMIEDDLDDRLEYLGFAPAGEGWSCSTPDPKVLGQKVECQYTGGILPGETKTLTLKVKPHLDGSDGQFATILNKATMTGVGGDGTGVPGRDNPPKDSPPTSVNLSEKVADLSLTKSAVITEEQDRVKDTSGSEVVYTLEMRNDPPAGQAIGTTQPAKTVKVYDRVKGLIWETVAATVGVTPYKSSKKYLEATALWPDGKEVKDACQVGGSVNEKEADVTCTFSNVPAMMAADAPYKVVIKARLYVDPTATSNANTITNTANISSDDTAEDNKDNNDPKFTVELTALTDMTVTKQASPEKAAAAQAITYTVAAKNAGPSQARDVSLVDTLPIGAIWVGNSPTVDEKGSCSLADGTPFSDGLVITKDNQVMTCVWGSYAFIANSQQNVKYQLRSVAIPEGENPVLYNHVAVKTSTPETDYTNNTAEETVPLDKAQVDVLINMQHTNDGIPAGNGETQYTITVTNSGSSLSYATGVKMVNLFPLSSSTAEFQFVSLDSVALTNGGKRFDLSNCKAPAAGAVEGPELVCDFPWLAKGESVDIKFTMAPTTPLDGRPVGTINHRATVSADVEYLPEADVTANNQTTDRTSTYDPDQIDPDEVEKLRYIDLSLKKEADAPADGIAVGSTITYRLIVKNEENPAANPPLHLRNGSAVVTDKLPEGLELDGTAPAGCDYAPDTRTLVCTVTELDAGASTTFEFSVTVESLAPSQTSVLNKALLTSPGDPVEPNNEDEEEVPVGEVDLSLVKSVDKTEAEVGDTLVYSLVVTNHGPMNSTGAVVTDLWPEELQFVSADAACQLDAGEVRCDVGELANGASKTFQLSAIVGDAALGMMVTNVAKVKAPGDKKPENDESTTTTKVPEKSPETGLPEPEPEPEEPEEKPTPEPTPVPTMGTAGLILMSLMVAGMAGLRQRRRR